MATVDEPVPVSDDVPASLAPLRTRSRIRRARVTELAAGLSPSLAAARERPLLDMDLVTGRAVHRLLAHEDAHDHEATLRARVMADLDPDERLAVVDAGAFADDVLALVRDVWRDEPLRTALASADARFEVPIVFRHETEGTVRLVRGTMDCLVPVGDQLLVLEFKTGRPQPAHRRQLDLYVDAVRAMRPGTRVGGRLIYATRPEPPRPMTAGRLPFDE